MVTRPLRLSFLIGLVAALSCHCGGQESGPSQMSAEARILPPEVLERIEPQLSTEVSEALWDEHRDVKAFLRIAVRRDGSIADVKVLSTEPVDLPVARAFAEEVSSSVRLWRCKPATRNGVPIDAELDVTVEAAAETAPEG